MQVGWEEVPKQGHGESPPELHEECGHGDTTDDGESLEPFIIGIDGSEGKTQNQTRDNL